MSREGRVDEAEHSKIKIKKSKKFRQELTRAFLFDVAPRRPKEEGSTHCAFQFYVMQQFLFKLGI